jgi:hypothetical protein
MLPERFPKITSLNLGNFPKLEKIKAPKFLVAISLAFLVCSCNSNDRLSSLKNLDINQNPTQNSNHL